MGKAIYKVGTVISGDYNGKNIYKKDNNSFMIVSNDEYGKIITNSLLPTHYSILKELSKATVDHYVDVSTAKQGADTSAIANGLFWAGAIGGLIGAATTSQSATYDMAVYFKNGEKSLIRIENSNSYQDLKGILFVL